MEGACVKCFLNGVHDMGKGGVVFVKGEETMYVFPRQFPVPDFVSGLQKLLHESTSHQFFVVEQVEGQALVRCVDLTSALADVTANEENKLKCFFFENQSFSFFKKNGIFYSHSNCAANPELLHASDFFYI